MSRWIIFTGITAMLVTGYFATFSSRGEGFLRSVKFMPSTLQVRVQSVLESSGATWAEVEMDGQRAVLSGMAPSELDRDDAIETAKRAAGPGGALWGGITKVDGDRIKVASPQKPFNWQAKSGEKRRVSLRGFVPSQKFKRLVAAEAKKLFPLGIEDHTKVASGHPTGDWLNTAILGLQQLQALDDGEVIFEDGRITVLGLARTAYVKEKIETALRGVKRPFEAHTEVSLIDGQNTAAPEDPSIVEPEATSIVQRLPAADCQKLVDQAMRSNVIYFDPGSSTIGASGLKAIDGLAQTALQCPNLKLKISGHSDGSELEADATDLSRKRSHSALKALGLKGISAERLVAIGVGASQPDPDAAVDELSRNRRVEFSVIP